MNDSMLQRVAFAISNNGEALPAHLAMARRAIEAMQMPSPVMRRLGATFFDDDNASSNELASVMVYTAMIGGALGGGQMSSVPPEQRTIAADDSPAA